MGKGGFGGGYGGGMKGGILGREAASWMINESTSEG